MYNECYSNTNDLGLVEYWQCNDLNYSPDRQFVVIRHKRPRMLQAVDV